MVEPYVQSMIRVLESLFSKFMELALPLSIFGGLVLGAIYYRDRSEVLPKFRSAMPFAFVFLAVAFFWSLLGSVRGVARDLLDWKSQAMSTAQPTAEAPPWYQYSPSAVCLVEKTYTRTLTLPPDFATRIGADGLGVLAPYLTDPTTENVLRLVDSFKRNGADVLFTREVTRLDEQPIGFQRADVHVDFKRQGDTGYGARFKGTYSFSNPESSPKIVRFVFPMNSQGNTVRELALKVGNTTISEPDDKGNFTWEGQLGAGESQTVEVTFATDGGDDFRYDFGSNRRAVKDFSLAVTSDGEIKFRRGGILPEKYDGQSAIWKLTNVVTVQAISLSFIKDTWKEDGYLQSLSMLRFTFIFVVLLVLALPVLCGLGVNSFLVFQQAMAYGVALLSVPTLYGYIGDVAVYAAPILGGLAVGLLGARKWVVPILLGSLLPAAMLSPTNSGLLILALLVCIAFSVRSLANSKDKASWPVSQSDGP